jgi:hypothetical protein
MELLSVGAVESDELQYDWDEVESSTAGTTIAANVCLAIGRGFENPSRPIL